MLWCLLNLMFFCNIYADKRMRKQPSTMTNQAREQLQLSFQKDPCPNRFQKKVLEKQLGLSKKVIQTWFDNK